MRRRIFALVLLVPNLLPACVAGSGAGSGSSNQSSTPCATDTECAHLTHTECSLFSCISGICEVIFKPNGYPCGNKACPGICFYSDRTSESLTCGLDTAHATAACAVDPGWSHPAAE